MGLTFKQIAAKHLDIASKFFSVLTVEGPLDVERFNMNYMKHYSYKLLNQWRKLDNLICVFAIFGYFISLVEYELCFSDKRTHTNCKNSQNDVLRWFTMATSIIASVIVYIRYRVQSAFYKSQSKNPYKGHFRFLFKRKTFLILTLLTEVVLLWIFPFPHAKFETFVSQASKYVSLSGKSRTLTICYTYAELAFIAMSCRFYFILKFVLNSSSYRDMFSIYFCNKFNTRAGFRFALKSLMAKHQYKVFFLIVFPSLLLSAEVLRIFERPFSDESKLNFNSFQNSIWCLFTSMSTVGYGDFSPWTTGGRLICFISTFWGGFSLSWVLIFLSSWLYLSPEEEMTLEKIQKSQDRKIYDVNMVAIESVRGSSIFYDDFGHIPKEKRALNTLVKRLMVFEEKLDKLGLKS